MDHPIKPKLAKKAPVKAEKIVKALSRSHRFFAEILELFASEDYGRIARAIGLLNQKAKITQDGKGKYQPRSDKSAKAE